MTGHNGMANKIWGRKPDIQIVSVPNRNALVSREHDCSPNMIPKENICMQLSVLATHVAFNAIE